MAAAVRWARDAVGPSAHLEAELDGEEQVTLVVQASLGALSTEWSQEVTETGTVAVSIAPPKAAFLDPLAEDYVTGLSAKLVARDASGRVQWIAHAPPAFLAWPSGASGAPVVWDAPTMEVEAPLGVVDPAVRKVVDDGESTRVLPPLYAAVVRDETPPAAEDAP